MAEGSVNYPQLTISQTKLAIRSESAPFGRSVSPDYDVELLANCAAFFFFFLSLAESFGLFVFAFLFFWSLFATDPSPDRIISDCDLPTA